MHEVRETDKAETGRVSDHFALTPSSVTAGFIGGHVGFERVVVAGGAGFIGTHLCRRLLDDGAQVVCVDNFATAPRSGIRSLLTRAGFTLVEGDICRPVDLDGPVDLVVNLASPASPHDYARLPVETLLTGSLGTHHLLNLAQRTSARFVLASTSEVYGDPLEHPQRESYRGNVNPVGPRSMYDEAKRFAEALTVAFAGRTGLSVGIARLFNCYGPGLRPDDGRAVPTFIWQALHGQPLTVAGDGSQTRSVCYVDDIVDGLIRLSASSHRGPVNLGATEEITIEELARRIRSVAGSAAPIRYVPRPAEDPSVRRPDLDLARSLLGWEPVTTLEEGLARTVDWFRALAGPPVAAVGGPEVDLRRTQPGEVVGGTV